jgi:spermidine synthase
MDPGDRLLTLTDVGEREDVRVHVLESAATDAAVVCELLRAGKYDKPIVVDDAQHRALCFEIGDSIQSEMRLDDPAALVCDYTRKMMGFLLFCPEPRHVLMIGLGGGSLLKFCHRHLLETRLTVVEIDANVIALRSHFGIPADDDRLTIVHADGADYVADMAAVHGEVDVLLVDAFDRRGLSPSVAGDEFMGNAGRVLTDCGVFVINLDRTESGAGELARVIQMEFGEPVIRVDVGLANAIAFAGPALQDRRRLSKVASRAERVRDDLGLGFRKLPGLVQVYMQQGAIGTGELKL